MDNQYIIPANAKKGQLIFNVFRMIDLVVLGIGIILSLFMIFLVPGDGLVAMVIKLLPLGICLLLVMPVAYYHNVMEFIKDVYIFIISQKQFKWKGWCATSEYGNTDSKK